MSRLSDSEREAILRDAGSPELRADFAASARVREAWDRAHPVTLEGIPAWIDDLRALFGDPPVDRTSWRGDDFRL